MCRPIRDHRRRRPRHLNGSWDDVLAHICLPTIPAKLSAQVSVVLHSSISREDARAWNYNGIDRNRTEDGQRQKGAIWKARRSDGTETANVRKAKNFIKHQARNREIYLQGRGLDFPRLLEIFHSRQKIFALKFILLFLISL